MRLRLLLAWRNLWRNKRRTYITLASIIFAVVIATFMRGVQLGSYESMQDNTIRSSTGHLALMEVDYWDEKTLINSFEPSDELFQALEEDEQIDFWIPSVNSGCLVSSGKHTRGVVVMGVDPVVQDTQIGMRNKIIAGEYLKASDRAIIMGKDLARFLQVEIGDTLVLYGQGNMGVTAAGQFPLKGIFDHPMSDFNRRMVYMPIQEAQYLFFMEGRYTQLSIVLNDVDDLEEAVARYEELSTDTEVVVLNWRVMNQALLQGIESDNFFAKIMIGILYMVIGFGIFGTILMMTLERKREFSIMIALGMKRRQLLYLVTLEAIMMAVIGSIIGLAISIPFIWFYHSNPIQITGEIAEMYHQMNMKPEIPVSTRPLYMIYQFLIILALSILASILPLYNILRFDIVEIIRGRQ